MPGTHTHIFASRRFARFKSFITFVSHRHVRSNEIDKIICLTLQSNRGELLLHKYSLTCIISTLSFVVFNLSPSKTI